MSTPLPPRPAVWVVSVAVLLVTVLFWMVSVPLNSRTAIPPPVSARFPEIVLLRMVAPPRTTSVM